MAFPSLGFWNPRTLGAALVGLSALGINPNHLHASGTLTNCTESDLRFALFGGGTVVLSCDVVIPLTSGIVVSKPTILDGTGHSAGLTGSGSTNIGPLLLVQRGATLTLRNLTLTKGLLAGPNGANGLSGETAQGAAIYNDGGSVILEKCTISNHSVTGGSGANSFGEAAAGNGGGSIGAAIFNGGGQLFITNCAFIANKALGGLGGDGTTGRPGGNGSNGSDGGHGGIAKGAAIYNGPGAVCQIFASTFASNTVTGAASGIGGASSGTLGFPGDNGRAGSGTGGAIFNEDGTLIIVNSTFLANAGFGAAGENGYDGTVTLGGSDGSAGGAAYGAGIFSSGGRLALTNCTFVANSLTGGKGGAGGAGETFGFGSNGAEGGHGGAAEGAGVCIAAKATADLVNCSFSDNKVAGGLGGPGGAGRGFGEDGDTGDAGTHTGGAIANQGGTLNLKNSILAFSLFGSNASGAVADQGFNLSSDATPKFSAPGSRNQIDPGFGSFMNAGGAVAVLTLAPTSPAIDAITSLGANGGPPYDARNASRVGTFDMGAFESDGVFGLGQLTALRDGDNLVLSWPAAGDFKLQKAAGLSPAQSWLNLTNQIEETGVRTFRQPATNRSEFYRLVKP